MLRIWFGLVMLLLLSTALPANAVYGTNPVIYSVLPNTVNAGSADLTMTINGKYFNTSCRGLWGATRLTTTYINGQTLTAVVPASLLTTAGTANISVGCFTGLVTFTIASLPPPPAPTITLSANPTAIALGASSTLNWSTTNAQSVDIEPGIGIQAVNGTKTVAPTATATYTGTATGAGGTVSQAVTVTVTSTVHSAVLKWSTSTGAISYNVYRSSTAAGLYTQIRSGITLLTYQDSSVTSGSTYYYVVTAVNSIGESSYSNQVAAVIP